MIIGMPVFGMIISLSAENLKKKLDGAGYGYLLQISSLV